MLIEVNKEKDGIRKIISYCIGYPSEEKVSAKLDEYFSTDSLKLYRTADYSGIIGIELKDNGKIEIKHIAVDPVHRKQSIGKKMIDEISAMTKCSLMFLETSDHAVGFYRKCGFSAKSLGEKYPGIVRYYCEKNV
jgi:ribosomal protein S18 acetylase RimI-like enzyme